METIDAKGLSDRMKSGEKMVLLDVREQEELTGELGHLGGIVHIPLGQLPMRVSELRDKDADVIMICKVGGRAARAGEFLESNGFKKVIVLEGGMTAWNEAGLPVSS
jgi:rhodanese-related sulfurtransferase